VTLYADFLAGPLFVIPLDVFPATGMRVGLAAGMALDTHIPFGMAALARLQVPTRFGRMLIQSKTVLLPVGSQHQVRFDLQTPLREPVMAGRTVLLVMTAVTGLWIVFRLEGMKTDKIAPMAVRFVVSTKGVFAQIGIDAATLVAVKTE
jgi:hypothetical protein